MSAGLKIILFGITFAILLLTIIRYWESWVKVGAKVGRTITLLYGAFFVLGVIIVIVKSVRTEFIIIFLKYVVIPSSLIFVAVSAIGMGYCVNLVMKSAKFEENLKYKTTFVMVFTYIMTMINIAVVYAITDVIGIFQYVDNYSRKVGLADGMSVLMVAFLMTWTIIPYFLRRRAVGSASDGSTSSKSDGDTSCINGD